MNIGIGDISALAQLAWSVYKACRDSSSEFQNIKNDVAALHAVIKETEELIHLSLSPDQLSRLETLQTNCTNVLLDLKRLVDGYESLGTNAQRTWDRLRWGLEDVSEVRGRLVATSTMLGAFCSAVVNSTTARIEQKLNKFIAECRHGQREGSIISSTSTVESVGTKEAWAQLRRELEDVGLSKTVISENQAYITSWFKQALAAGLLDEGDIDQGVFTARALESDQVTLAMSDSRDSALGSSIQGGASVVDATSASEFGIGSIDTNISPPLKLSDNPFFDAARARYADDTVSPSQSDPSLPPISPYNSNASRSSSVSSTTSPRKGSRKFSSLVFKLFQSPQAIIEAASDGDTEKVTKLIALGADVNAVDKWKWTALSMAAYGGYSEIAKILMAAGAKLDTKDVDGDSPLDLAVKRGHREVVLLIEEEETRRDMEAIGEA